MADKLVRKFIRSLNSGKNKKRVLDFACGENIPNKKMFLKLGWKYTGIDLMDSEKIIKWKIGTQFPFHEKSFDLILCNGAIFLVDDISFVLEEFFRVLDSSGILLFTTPILSPLSTSISLNAEDAHEKVRLMPLGVERKLNESNFREIEICYTRGGVGTIMGLLLYFTWESLFKTKRNRYRRIVIPLFPLFLLFTLFLNLLGLILNRILSNSRFASFMLVKTVKSEK